MYDGLSALIGAKVVSTDENTIVFDNGLRIVCEDIGNYIEVKE